MKSGSDYPIYSNSVKSLLSNVKLYVNYSNKLKEEFMNSINRIKSGNPLFLVKFLLV